MARGLSPLQRVILQMAYKNRVEEGEPGSPPTRVILLDDPEEKRDLRSLAPEAFTRYPDGLWEERRDRFYLVVGVFSRPSSWEERKRLREDLSHRGLRPCESHANSYQCDLFSSDVLCEYYGFQKRFHPVYERPPGFPKAHVVREWRNCCTEDRNSNAPRVAVSRAFDRLSRRGLAERRGAAINLTERGAEIARELMVNRADTISSINH